MSLNSNTLKYVPTSARDGCEVNMSIVAYPGDVEITGAEGIANAFNKVESSFVGVVTAIPNSFEKGGCYEKYTDSEMRTLRLIEQQKAANIGSYQALFILNHKEEFLTVLSEEIIGEYVELLSAYIPDVIYTHSLFDLSVKNVNVVLMVIEAVKRLPIDMRPSSIIMTPYVGGFDWLTPDKEIVFLDYESRLQLISALVSIYDTKEQVGEYMIPADAGIDIISLVNDDILPYDYVKNKLDKFTNHLLENISK